MTALASETDLLHAWIAHVPYALPHVRVFRRMVLNVETTRGFRARNGIPGQADAYALVRGGGHVEIETKSARGQLQAKQQAWRHFCAGFAIPHLVLRVAKSELPAVTIQRWTNELHAIVGDPT